MTSGTRHRVLIVDDNALNLRLLEVVLRAGGFSVSTATDAESAWRVLETHVPEVVVMDLQLPGVDGLTLTRQMRGHERYARLKIVAVTSYAMLEDRERALAAGCDEYFSKPIDTRTFVEKIAAIAQTRNRWNRPKS